MARIRDYTQFEGYPFGYGEFELDDGSKVVLDDPERARKVVEERYGSPDSLGSKVASETNELLARPEDRYENAVSRLALGPGAPQKELRPRLARPDPMRGAVAGPGGGIDDDRAGELAGAMDADQLGAYDTRLSPSDEKALQAWKKQYAPDDSGGDYDLRGAYKAGLKPDPQNGHWPDTFKKPNHPTFSEESQYHGKEYRGGRWVYAEDGKPMAFEQSDTNAQHWPEWAIKDYLNRAEPGVALKKKGGR